MSVSYITGPLGGGWLSEHYGYAAPFWGVLGLLALTTVFIAVYLPSAPPARPSEKIRYFREFTNLRNVFLDGRIRRIYLANFLLFFALFGYFRVVTVVMYDAYHITSQSRLMAYYAYASFLALLTNLFLTPVLVKRFALRPLLTVLLVISAAGLVINGLPVFAEPRDLIWIFLLTAIAPCAALACAGALLSGAVEPHEQGAVLGNNQALPGERRGALRGGPAGDRGPRDADRARFGACRSTSTRS